MNRQPFGKPPQWWAPKLSPWMIRFWRPLRRRKQFREHRLQQIDVRGLEHLRSAIESNQGVLITPNHSGHADSYVLYHAADQLGCPLFFMAAWQVFGKSGRIRRRILQQHGCFSVDREGTDMRAFKQAVEILQQRPNPLVIFPEGEVYHLNERVTPFREGAASIALSAARKSDREIVAVPCAVRYIYTSDPTPELQQIMTALEEHVFWRPRPDLPLRDRIYRFADGMIALKEVEFLGRQQTGLLYERISHLSDCILQRLEQQYDLAGAEEFTIPQRVKNARRELISQMQRADDDALLKKRLAEEMDDLFLVVQMFSYPGDYVAERPTIERMAETIDKFEEDFLGRPTAGIRASRRAIVSFGAPISVESTRGRSSTLALTNSLETAVQDMLDATDDTFTPAPPNVSLLSA